ncbi:hypothetical protein EDB85DRAFT_1871191 [Lactarius pseudohatsudake]|nr:hypothetical protein EDB85DRAFT_1871191 [Lactarius pseudohatsudake]
MPRILDDPTRATCPSFEGNEWDFLRQTMINGHPGADPLTEEGATLRLKEAWARENANKVAAWNEQLEQVRAEQEELDRQAQEEEDAQQILRDKETEEQRKEVEKKKPKLNPFDPNCTLGKYIEPRPAQYALNKINNLEYVELDYFTLKGCKDASADANKSISQDTLTFTQVEGSFAIRPLAAIKPSRNIRCDEDLGWEEMFGAKNTMLHFMGKSRAWPSSHAISLAAFFVALELHPRRNEDNGKKILITYQSRVRHEWFDALKRNEGFNIEVLSEEYLQSIAEEVNKKTQDDRIDQVRSLLLTSPSGLRANSLPLSSCSLNTLAHPITHCASLATPSAMRRCRSPLNLSLPRLPATRRHRLPSAPPSCHLLHVTAGHAPRTDTHPLSSPPAMPRAPTCHINLTAGYAPCADVRPLPHCRLCPVP